MCRPNLLEQLAAAANGARIEAKKRQQAHGGTAPGRKTETLIPKPEQVFQDAGKTANKIAASIVGVGTGGRNPQLTRNLEEAEKNISVTVFCLSIGL